MANYSDGYEYHIHLSQGDIGRYVFLPGDPGRCEVIAQHFDNPRFVASHRIAVSTAGGFAPCRCPVDKRLCKVATPSMKSATIPARSRRNRGRLTAARSIAVTWRRERRFTRPLYK